ncbi:MAG: MaoC family dehydratase N-terminal domain-containing protein [Dehalococcoidia bacterium]|nr:MaoC family dehydratase N-terminal domain-containing protein [Dehalococcoidia bacterium]
MTYPLISTATVGHEFGPYDVTISSDTVNLYTKAIGGGESPDYGDSQAPLILVAVALTKLIDELGLFSGGLQTIHAGQEVSWTRPVKIGEKIDARGKLSGNSVRGNNRFVTVKVSYNDETRTEVGSSSTTIIVNTEHS